MSKHRADTICPSCKGHFLTEVDVPDVVPIVSGAIVPDVGAQVKQAVQEALKPIGDSAKELDQLRADLANANEHLAKVQAGDAHGDPARTLAHFANCPECQPALDEFLGWHDAQLLGSLSTDKVKVLAKEHKIWPPPNFDFPGVHLQTR